MDKHDTATRDLLLRRSGLVFVDAAPSTARVDENLLRALDLELAAIGAQPSTRLRRRLGALDPAALAELKERVTQVLLTELGGATEHTPLFRGFPEDVPEDTFDLWVKKVVSHFAQAEGQPCLFCRSVGTTHVLRPCRHVVCDRCFDGANYSACPVCEHHVDRSSPFFKPDKPRRRPKEAVRFRLLDLGDDLEAAAIELFHALCRRTQAMSPVDVADLRALVGELGELALARLPEVIPVRENIAHVLGALFLALDPARVMPVVEARLDTATDVLRLIAAISGASPSLQPTKRAERVTIGADDERWRPTIRRIFRGKALTEGRVISIATTVRRFRVAPMRRALRRALLQRLEALNPDARTEDMLRHRSLWVWIGEHLHPGEYADRYPGAAASFAIVRRKDPKGARAPKFTGFYGRVERAALARDAGAFVDLLARRPGELARRLDQALRLAGDDAAARARVLAAFEAAAPRCTTPVLLTLRGLLPGRVKPAPIRVFWPKGEVVQGFSSEDRRPTLAPEACAAAVEICERELLRRLAEKPRIAAAVIDDALATVIVPFNERTASKAAVALPRGSTIAVPPGKVARLFLHWCQPERGGETTDIDLSVGFYDASWRYLGVCSYYNLTLTPEKEVVARSSGDLRSAPFPNGASEFVDVHRAHALAAGLRYAVMVVNNYAGMPFSRLERGFAGLMLRDDVGGKHFDPRTVALRFDLQGDNGVYMPMVFDLAADRLHWLDVYAKGTLQMNNVDSSNAAITRICPEMIAYFGSGVRPSIRELALLHAAARSDQVVLRGERTRVLRRAPGEDAASFLQRLRSEEGAEAVRALRPAALADGAPIFAALFRGDLEVPAGSVVVALYREQILGPIAASDLLS
ncbi:MAG: MXAN_6230/SCO0854 family RING domain-containing protein [Nannocystaceae bacterium]